MKKLHRVRGFSLLELMIAMGILVIVMGMVYLALHRSSDLYTANSKHAWVIHQARAALDEMAEQLRQGNRLSIQPTPTRRSPLTGTLPEGEESSDGTQLSFKRVLSPVAGVPTFSNLYTTYFLETSNNNLTTSDPITATAYPLTGSTWVDANGNGVADDWRLVRIDPNPNDMGQVYAAKILSNYVKAGGFKVSQTYITVNGIKQFQLKISLTVVTTDMRNKAIEQTLETKVFLRNYQ